MTSAITPTVRRPRRVPIVPIVIVAAFFVGMLGASRISTLLSSHVIPWQPSAGLSGARFDPATVQTMTVVNVDVEWPGCIKPGDSSWMTPEVSYTPWSVTITLRTNDIYASKCTEPRADGRLPNIGSYLSALSFPVQLSEPLGGRPLFDGSSFPATERYRA
jgi:hypothetical protein